MEAEGQLELRPKKEAMQLRKSGRSLSASCWASKTHGSLARCPLAIDTRKERIALREAKRLGIRRSPCGYEL